MGIEVLKAKDIHKRFGALEVLRGISLEIAPHAVTAIVGASGAGKTTLLQVLGTLERPDSGEVTYGDTRVYALSDNELSRFRNRHIGFVFQLHRLLPEFTAQENVALPAMIGGEPRGEAMRRAAELLEVVGLSERLRHRPSQLSGGERQRVAVARALINNPDVILADEPSGSLDTHNKNELHRVFFDLAADRGQTIVIVTHDEQLAARAHHVLHINDGLIVANDKH